MRSVAFPLQGMAVCLGAIVRQRRPAVGYWGAAVGAGSAVAARPGGVAALDGAAAVGDPGRPRQHTAVCAVQTSPLSGLDAAHTACPDSQMAAIGSALMSSSLPSSQTCMA